MDEKYKKILNKNMNNNNYFKYISNNVIQKNKDNIVINQMLEQLFIVNFSYYIKNNHKIYEELLSKNHSIMKEKIFYLKNYILNTVSSDLLNLKIKNHFLKQLMVLVYPIFSDIKQKKIIRLH